jgi:glutathione S-transferase
MAQSPSVVEQLEEVQPEPARPPPDPAGLAVVRTIAAVVACVIHPLNNQRVARSLAGMGVADAEQRAWLRRWITDGFSTLEPLVARRGAAALSARPRAWPTASLASRSIRRGVSAST